MLDYKSYLAPSIYQPVPSHLPGSWASSPSGPLPTRSPAKSLIWLMIMGALKFKNIHLKIKFRMKVVGNNNLSPVVSE